MEKFFLYGVLLILYVVGIFWVFNHVNVWISFAMGVGLVYFLLRKLGKLISQYKN